MKDINKLDKRMLTFIGACIVIVSIIACFIIALKNHKSNNSSTSSKGESASDISSKYDDIDYGSSSDLEDEKITSGGSYDLSGSYGCITVNTSQSVQLNLENAEIACQNGPAIYVQNSDTTKIVLKGANKITSTTTTDLDGAIYSKDDLILSGTGSLEVNSNYDGIVSKDTLVIDSGTYVINASDDGIRGKDNVAIVDGDFTITAKGDGIKSTNEQDSSKGYVAIDGGKFNITSVNDGIQAETELVIKGGEFTIKTSGNANTDSAKGLKAGVLVEINGGTFDLNTTDDGIHSNGNATINKGNIKVTSKDDGIHADGLVEINDGTIDITAVEGIEGTYVKINGGNINISASDDGINAANKSRNYSVAVEINGGNITIKMGNGDTDGIDSNGNLYINGGTIDITCNSPFDYDGESKYTGGTIIVNGEETNTITNQMMGGRPGGMNSGGPGGNRGFGRR